MRRRTAFVLALVLTAIPAQAVAGAGVGAPGGHCVYRLVPIGPGVEPGAVEAAIQEEGCYATLEDALSVGTGLDVDLADGVTVASLTQETLDASVGDGLVAAADVLLGTEYNEGNYFGASASYYASSGCANTTWEVSYVGNSWNDLFESGKGFGTCDRNRKFEHSDFGGRSILCTPNCSDYGQVRNRVSSLRWRN